MKQFLIFLLISTLIAAAMANLSGGSIKAGIGNNLKNSSKHEINKRLDENIKTVENGVSINRPASIIDH